MDSFTIVWLDTLGITIIQVQFIALCIFHVIATSYLPCLSSLRHGSIHFPWYEKLFPFSIIISKNWYV